MSSSSPVLKESPQAFFHGCCPIPITRMTEPEHKPAAAAAKKQSTSAVSRRSFVTATSSSFFPSTQFTNHESIPSLEDAFAQFAKAYPKYSDTNRIDRIRALEYPQLAISNHVCLDYIGVGLFTQSQVVSSRQNSSKNLVDSSDSSFPPSKSSGNFAFFDVTFTPVGLKSRLLNGGESGSEMESCVRNKVMDFLNVSQDEYSMVFTANRSSAFKLVAESYPFRTNRKLLTVYDHKNEATDAMIDESVKRGANATEAEFKWPRLRIHSAKLKKMVEGKSLHYKNKQQRGLFVLPLQSRITGASYSYQWMTMAQENGWHVLLDACALSPKDMDSFGLSLFRPDFIVCSFYKVFGENPTGFACLLIKKSIVQILEDTKGMGIVSIIAPGKNLLSEDSSIEIEPIGAGESPNNGRFSDNKVEQIIIPEFRCLDHVDSLGLMLINSRYRYLINWLITALMKLQHPNRLEKFPLVTIYGPKVKFDRGPALAFNICDWKGERVDPAMVQKLADRCNISLSNGYVQNVWFPEKKQELEEKRRSFSIAKNQSEVPSKRGKDDGRAITVVTVALSFLADFEDVYRLWAFVAQFLDADFVEKERWRYTTLNEKTIEI